MRFFFVSSGSGGPDADDEGIEYPALDDALREAARTVLSYDRDDLLAGGEISIDIYTEQGRVGTASAILAVTKVAP